MVSVWSLAGVLFGAAGFGVGIYSHLQRKQFEEELQTQQEKFEEQIERKEELNKIARQLQEIVDASEEFRDLLSDWERPFDLGHNLTQVGSDVLKANHQEGGEVTVHVAHLFSYEEGKSDRIKLNSADEALEKMKTSGVVLSPVSIRTQNGEFESRYSHGLSEGIHNSRFIYSIIQDLNEKHDDIISEFDPTALEDIESVLDNIVWNIYSHMNNEKTSAEIDVDEYEDVEAIGEEIYDCLVMYPGIQQDLSDLSESIEEIDELRQSLVKASYS